MTAPPPHELVFNLQWTTLLASQRRRVHTDDRLVEAYQHFPDVRLMVAEPQRFLGAKIVKRLFGEPAARTEGDTELFAPWRSARQAPTSIAGVERAARRWDAALWRRVQAAGMRRPHVVLCNPFLAGLADLSWASSVVYYTHDDLATGDEGSVWRAAVEHSYTRVRTRSRAMASVAPVMLERVGTTGPTALIPNGVDVQPFLRAAVPDADLQRLPRPLAVYVGTLEGRIDRESLRAVSAALDGGSIALVGKETSPATRAVVEGIDNVYFAGPVSPDRVPAMLAAADLGVIPHAVSEVTVGMSPLKLYEYVAAGLPVVATDLPPMRGVSDRVILSPCGPAFQSAARQALALGRASDHERRVFAEANSWDSRARRLLDFSLEVERCH